MLSTMTTYYLHKPGDVIATDDDNTQMYIVVRCIINNNTYEIAPYPARFWTSVRICFYRIAYALGVRK
ncbi:hypothetical protein [Microcystis phage Mel-JY34]